MGGRANPQELRRRRRDFGEAGATPLPNPPHKGGGNPVGLRFPSRDRAKSKPCGAESFRARAESRAAEAAMGRRVQPSRKNLDFQIFYWTAFCGLNDIKNLVGS